MTTLKYRDLPDGLYLLMTYWLSEEAKKKVHKMPEEEKVKEFLEWCKTDYAQESMNEQDKKDLQKLLLTLHRIK